jgi:hypothetical protein
MLSFASASNIIVMKKTIAILVLAAAGLATANAGIHFGFNLGLPLPVPPRVVVAPAPVVVAPAPVVCEPTPMPVPIVETVPVCPTPGYVWVGGSWGWSDNHWAWTRGHWGPPVHREYAPYGGHGYRVEHREAYHAGFHRYGHR